MHKYELIVVLAGESTPAKQKSAKTKVEKIIEAQGGKVESSQDWGKKDLAYKIKKMETGVFTTFALELEPTAAKGIDTKLANEEDVIRYLLLKKD